MDFPWGCYFCLQLSEMVAVFFLRLGHAIRLRSGTRVLALPGSLQTILPPSSLNTTSFESCSQHLLPSTTSSCCNYLLVSITPHRSVKISSLLLTVTLSCYNSEWFQFWGRGFFQYPGFLVHWLLFLQCLPWPFSPWVIPQNLLPMITSPSLSVPRLVITAFPAHSPLCSISDNPANPWDLQSLSNTLNNLASYSLCCTCNPDKR